MDWLSWQDVLEEEIETAVEEKRPLPSETELMIAAINGTENRSMSLKIMVDRH